MENNNCRHMSIRLNYDNPEHVRIMDMLDDLNTEVHKSKNQFILTAITYYMDSIKSGDLTYSGRREQEEREARFATKEDVEAAVAGMSRTIKTELYEELIRFLGSMAFGTAVGRGMAGEMEPRQSGQMREEANYGSSGNGTMQTESPPEDVTEALSRFDNVLQHVMDWSED